MPKKITKKIFKVKKSKLIEQDHLVVRFKGLEKAEIKALRSDLDDFLAGYLDKTDENLVRQFYSNLRVSISYSVIS